MRGYYRAGMAERGTTELRASRFFDGDTMHGGTRVVLENGTVAAIEPCPTGHEHDLLSPGFVDLQVNGWGPHDVASADAGSLRAIDDSLGRLGTTSWLATLVTDSLDRMTSRVGSIHAAMKAGPTGCRGLHLEGPFLGRRAGAHATRHIIDVNESWISTLPDSVRLVTVGAEAVGAEAGIGLFRNRGVSVSIGHTDADRDQMERAVSAGASMVTHLFNAMSGVHHREFGVATFALTDDRLSCGLIADLVHVSADAVRLAFRARAGGICLVSDSVAWESEWALSRGIAVVAGAPRLPDGTLAGSSTNLAECVRRAIVGCNIEASLVLAAATSRPADTAGLRGVGRIRVGDAADVVALDSGYSVAGVWRRLPSLRDHSIDK